MDAGAPEQLQAGEVHVPHLYTGPDAPDVTALDAGKVQGPAEGQGAAAQDRQHNVAAILHPTKGLVGHVPDSRDAVRPFRLPKGFFKENPDMIIHVVGVAVVHVKGHGLTRDGLGFGHGDWSSSLWSGQISLCVQIPLPPLIKLLN